MEGMSGLLLLLSGQRFWTWCRLCRTWWMQMKEIICRSLDRLLANQLPCRLSWRLVFACVGYGCCMEPSHWRGSCRGTRFVREIGRKTHLAFGTCVCSLFSRDLSVVQVKLVFFCRQGSCAISTRHVCGIGR